MDEPLIDVDEFVDDLMKRCKPLLDKANEPMKLIWDSTTIEDDGCLVIWFTQEDCSDHVWQVRMPLSDDIEGTPATLHRLTG